MSRLEYEYECKRAELLGVEPPSWEDFSTKHQHNLDQDEHEEDTIDTAQAEEISHVDEGLQSASGGLEELNSILAVTQRKINKFKTVCGSFTNLLKIRGESSESNKSENPCMSNPETPIRNISGSSGIVQDRMASQVDRLDSLIDKAERAELSMSRQNKQMKQFLKS